MRSRSRRSRRPCTRRARRHPPARGRRPRAQRGSPRRRAASRCGPSPWRTRSRRCRRWRCGSRARSAPWSQSRSGRNIGQRQLRIDGDELDFDRKADAHLRGVDPDEVGHQARALGELDERDDVARIEAGQPGARAACNSCRRFRGRWLSPHRPRASDRRDTSGSVDAAAARIPYSAGSAARRDGRPPRRRGCRDGRPAGVASPGRSTVLRAQSSAVQRSCDCAGTWLASRCHAGRTTWSSTLTRISSPARMPPAASRDPTRAVKARRRARPLRLLFAPGCLAGC